ncbi:glycosyltransferase 87 family protein [Pararobbsia alpina]|uniref:glycosyltransferase 87 family protein n=1 Tax=Pararobbsia alpina TaxID=621374 RepID=UPI0039A62380
MTLLVVSQIIMLAYGIFLFLRSGRFPVPVFYDPYDTFMDFFNTNYWAVHAGRYDVWHSIYPIFTFVLGAAMTPARCVSQLSSVGIRTCASDSIGWIVAAYLAGAWVCALVVTRKLDETWPRRWWRVPVLTFVFALAAPALFAVERGNYIVIVFLCLGLSELSGRDWKGALLLALAINLKQYLVVLWLAPFLKRRFDYLALSVMMALAINWISSIALPDVHYSMLFENMAGFSTGASTSYFEKMWYATSFSAWVKAIDNSPWVGRLSPLLFSLGSLGVYSLRWISLALVGVSLLLLARDRDQISWEEISFVSLVSLMMLTDSIGGYALILAFPVAAVLVGRGRFEGMLVCLFILVTPLDFPVGPSHIERAWGYLIGRRSDYIASLSLGAYIRPFALLYLLWAFMLPQLREAAKTYLAVARRESDAPLTRGSNEQHTHG